MASVDINQLAQQAIPFLTFKDANGKSTAGSSIQVVTYPPPDMSKATSTTTSMTWLNTNPVSLTPSILDTSTFTNNTDVVQSQTFQHSSTDTQTFTWSLTETINLGVSNTAKGSFIFVEDQLTLSFSFTMGSTQSWTETTTQQLTVTFPLQVPPRTIVKASWVLDRLSNVTLPFSATQQLAGTISLEVFGVNGTFTWSGTAGAFITAAISGGAQGWTADVNTGTLTFTGSLLTDEGVQTNVVTEQFNLDGTKKVAA